MEICDPFANDGSLLSDASTNCHRQSCQFSRHFARMLYAPLADLARVFPLPWSHYVQLIGHSRSSEAFAFYQAEAIRGGWSVRQLRRQMDSQFYERTALSKNKTKMLREGNRCPP